MRPSSGGDNFCVGNSNNNIIRNKLGLPLNGQKLKTYLLETCKKLES